MTEGLLSTMDEWGPEKVVCVSDSRTGMRGVLVLDNTARGIGKGGTRMSPTLDVTEVTRLARTMTWKWAATDLFHGGAKAGILGDPDAPQKEEMLRAFARALSNEVPREYVLGLDMGLDERDAAILRDELGDTGAAVGLPAALGGVPYDELGVTGYGLAESVDAAAQHIGRPLSGSRVSLQGFGAVGAAAAKRLTELGAVIVALSTSHGAVHDPDGLDIAELLELRAAAGDACVAHYDAELLPVGVELDVRTDILVPAAREDAVDERTARETSAHLVVEGANLPTTPAAKAVLAQRGVVLVPDFIANAGGAVAAAFAMDARYSPFRPQPPQIFDTLSVKLRANTVQVLEESRARGHTPYETALALARERVHKAMALRGRLPRN
ncbi:Glu/Leu/Phe/Val family dehydrogenase [Streptomyces oceani]|uniref:Glutamate dehydrogenase n=1 Tax=Streptomyces oceani TaxID=1075402 RepID=A0A1E7KGU8_9ACTN|nr:Glu/Leu/Phe/Val dehydrogenase dimerization domain-containing protein [Streptomyces oceani]OEV03151.1 glutamate dehydrogenase [Streptomyces oceani]